MFTQELFELALNITSPWIISSVDFDVEKQKLDIHIDFERGSEFEYTLEDGTTGKGKAYDTVNKTWRHLNFFSMNVTSMRESPELRERITAFE